MIGRNLRTLRNRRGVSQTDLATQIGITFQQIQKYEKGLNRVSASTLLEIASALDFDVLDFFADVVEKPAVQPPAPADKLDLLIMRRVSGLRDGRVKRKLLHLLDSMAEAEETKSPSRSLEQFDRPAEHAG